MINTSLAIGEMMRLALEKAIKSTITDIVEQEAQAASERVLTEVRKRTAGIIAEVFRFTRIEFMENRIVIELQPGKATEEKP